MLKLKAYLKLTEAKNFWMKVHIPASTYYMLWRDVTSFLYSTILLFQYFKILSKMGCVKKRESNYDIAISGDSPIDSHGNILFKTDGRTGLRISLIFNILNCNLCYFNPFSLVHSEAPHNQCKYILP